MCVYPFLAWGRRRGGLLSTSSALSLQSVSPCMPHVGGAELQTSITPTLTHGCTYLGDGWGPRIEHDIFPSSHLI
uniref:Uncharacterized protein n=1 Tax=Macaca nemestrina TaxID=9545 RepID=A0A2K6ALM4_MACNE